MLEKNYVTREKVFAEANRLKALGIDLSVRKLLRALGGSATTISGLLREWRAQEEIEAPTSPEDIEIPAGVMAAAKLAAVDIWQVCNVESQKNVNLVTEQANQRVKEAQMERDQALVELAESEAELISAQDRAAELEAEVATVRQAVTAAANAEAGLKAAAAEMRHQIDAQMSELQQQRDAAASECDALRVQASKMAISLHEQLVGLREQVSALTAQRDAIAGECHALRVQVSSQLEALTAFSNVRLDGRGG